MIGCQQKTVSISKNNIELNASFQQDSGIIKSYLPYKNKLDSEMNEILAESEMEMIKKQPESLLGNFVADLSLQIAKKHTNKEISFCLLNYGGLRTALPKGAITRRKIFELMPFENELVVVQLKKSELDSIINYIKKVGGQPVSGISINYLEEPPLVEYNQSNDGFLYVLTTDYLAKGGDHMDFFKRAIDVQKVGIKLRDAIIEYCINQNKQNKPLTAQLDGRIKL